MVPAEVEMRTQQGWAEYGDWAAVAENGNGGHAPEIETDYETENGGDMMMRVPVGEYDPLDIDVEGSHIDIRHELVEAHVELLELKAETGKVTDEVLKDELQKELVEAESVMEEFKARLDAMAEEEKEFSLAVQDWALAELQQRELESGESPIPSSEEYRQDAMYFDHADERLVHVLNDLIAELEEDDEEEKLVAFAKVWRRETQAELNVSRLNKLYELAA